MAKAVKNPRKKAVNGYKMPDPLPQGEILTDITKNKWKLGPSIGKGGFGEIYSAQEYSTKTSKKFPYVIKVEPHENGPLFVEMHFYMKNAKVSDIDTFKNKHKLKTFGMPAYFGSGSHELGTNKYRFIVMEKFGTDIEKVRQENGGSFPVTTAFQLAWQMMYVLEYIHECDYVHADLKGANILMGLNPENKSQAYLVDFGLATKIFKGKDFKPNPKKANDGTIEYLSRDAHHGVPTRRGDLEILGYNIIHWLGGKLPWESSLSDVKAVHQGKEKAMSDIPKFTKTCFGSAKKIDTLAQFLKYVSNLKFDDKPDYNKIRDWFKKEVEKNGAKVDGPLEFQANRKRRSVGDDVPTPEKKTKDEKTPKEAKKGRGARKNIEDTEEIKDEEEVAQGAIKKGRVARKKREEEEEPAPEKVKEGRAIRRKAKENGDLPLSEKVVKEGRVTRQQVKKEEKEDIDSEETSKKKKVVEKGKTLKKKEEVMNDAMKEILAKKHGDHNGVMTDAMKEILAKKTKNGKKGLHNGEIPSTSPAGYTAEMKEILAKKTNRENKKIPNGEIPSTSSSGYTAERKKKPEMNISTENITLRRKDRK